MDDITKNVIAMLIFVILLGAMGVTLFMIIKVQTTDDKILGDEYVIPVQIANAIISVVLSYIVATDESMSSIYKLFVVLLVLASIGGEIYYTGYVDRKFETTPTYAIVAISFLLRSFLLLGYARGVFPQTIQTNVIAPVQTAVTAAAKPITNMMAPPKKVEPVQSDLISKWKQLKKKIEEKGKIDNDSQETAWKTVVSPAKQAGRTDIKAVLKEAIKLMKFEDGSTVPANIVDSVGGARK